MSPLAFVWQDCRRVRDEQAERRELSVNLLYPTYREGLRALLAAPVAARHGEEPTGTAEAADPMTAAATKPSRCRRCPLECFAFARNDDDQCKLGPLRNRSRSLDFTCSSMVSPSR